jgi:uncharacterized protein (DUF433 family)
MIRIDENASSADRRQRMTTATEMKATVQRTEHPHIVKSADIVGGMPRIEGTRFSVLQVRNWFESGMDFDYIVENFPPLTLAQIFDALSYSYDHPDELAEHRSRHTLRSVLKRADLVYVDGRLIPRFAFNESDVPPGATVYTWDTVPEDMDE